MAEQKFICPDKQEYNLKKIIIIKTPNNYLCYTIKEFEKIVKQYQIPGNEENENVFLPIVIKNDKYSLFESRIDKDTWVYNLPYTDIYVDYELNRLFNKGVNSMVLTKERKKKVVFPFRKEETVLLYSVRAISRCQIDNYLGCEKDDSYFEKLQFDYELLSAKDRFWFKKNFINSIGLENQLLNVPLISGYSNNPNITWDIVNTFNDINWDYNLLSRNPNITLDIVFQHKERKWDYISMLSYNINLTFDYIIKNPYRPDGQLWSIKYLTINPNVTWEIIVQNQHFPEGHPKAGGIIPWDSKRISANPNITWDIITTVNEFPNGDKIEWDYNILSGNPNITWENVNSTLDKGWNFRSLSVNPNITLNTVIMNMFTPDLKNKIPWSFRDLSRNPNITKEIVKEYIQKPNNYIGLEWDNIGLSANPNLSFDFLHNELKIPIDIIQWGYTLNKYYYDDVVFKKIYAKYMRYKTVDRIENIKRGRSITSNNLNIPNPDIFDYNILKMVKENLV